jgi:hypothetical protein
MITVRGYMIRHQRGGFLTGTVYAKPPSAEEFKAKTETLGPGWANLVPVELVLPDDMVGVVHLFDAPSTPVAAAVEPAAPKELRLALQGSGQVTPRRKA